MSERGLLSDRAVSLVRNKRFRWLAYAVSALVLAALCIMPRPYLARAKILPADSSAGGLVGVFSALGGQAQNLSSLFGDRGAIDVSLSIARSEAVTNDVIKRLGLVGPDARYSTVQAAQIALGKKVDVHSLTGGMLEIETKAPDADWALLVTKAYVGAISERIGTFGQAQTARKRQIVDGRLKDALERLTRAEAELNEFRLHNQLADPQLQLGSQMSLRTSLQRQLQAKQVELQALSQTAGPENPALGVVTAQLETLTRQLAQTAQVSSGSAGPSVSGLTVISLQYANLFRNYTFMQAIYDVYSRSAEGVAVQEMAAQNASNITVVDSAHVDPERYFNVWAVAMLGLLVILALFTEFYAPATGLFDLRKSAKGPDETEAT